MRNSMMNSINLLLYYMEGTGKFGEFTVKTYLAEENLMIFSILRPKFIYMLSGVTRA